MNDKLGFVKIEPFVSERLNMTYKGAASFFGSFYMKNVKFYGTSRLKVQRLKSNFGKDEMSIRAEFFFPKLLMSAVYKSNITMNRLVIPSKGQFNMTMKNVLAKVLIKGKIESIDGENYMRIYKFDMDPEPTEMVFSVTGIFPDPNLSKFSRRQYFHLKAKLFPFRSSYR